HSENNTQYQARKGSMDLGKYTIEGSRPFSALALHGALQVVGKAGYSEMLESNYDKAQTFGQLIAERAEFELYENPELNILLYRYIPTRLRYKVGKEAFTVAEQQQINAINEALQKRQFEKGHSFVSYTRLLENTEVADGIVWLRAVLMNPYTTEVHLAEILQEQVDIVMELEGKSKAKSRRALHERKVPIGKSIANVQTYILDEQLNLCSIGVVGEICIGGAGITQGYINNPDMNAEKFIAHPFKAGERLCRTGDLGRRLPDGNIEYVGRKDDQIKIRGYRVELGEIESVLQQVPEVSQSVVLLRKDLNGHQRLVAYVVPQGAFDKNTVLHYVKSQLPDYMVPSLIFELPKMPLTTSGKIDKKALKNLDITALIATDYVAPRNETEITLVQIWQKILQVERVGIKDNFFELGGHSLLATRMLSAIKKAFGVTIPLNILFQFTCIADLSGYMEAMNAVGQRKNNSTDAQVIEI
ncbi:MAG: phosphopantetheine-binding protein, partial [Bacteroidota bacterium]